MKIEEDHFNEEVEEDDAIILNVGRRNSQSDRGVKPRKRAQPEMKLASKAQTLMLPDEGEPNEANLPKYKSQEQTNENESDYSKRSEIEVPEHRGMSPDVALRKKISVDIQHRKAAG